MAKFIFTRHGETEDTVNLIFSGGNTDSTPTERGVCETYQFVKDFHAKHGFDICLTSGMARTKLFGIEAARLGVPVFHDVRLKEKLAGIFEGTTRDNFLAVDGEKNYVNRWNNGLPNGESHFQVCRRVAAAMTTWTGIAPDKTFLVGSHTDVIRALRGLLSFSCNSSRLLTYLIKRMHECEFHQREFDIGLERLSIVQHGWGGFSKEELAALVAANPELREGWRHAQLAVPSDEILASKVDYFDQITITVLPEVIV